MAGPEDGGPVSRSPQLDGGMGVVYTAQDPRLKRQVAIKLLTADLTRDETAKQRFLQEAQAASALDHPNICTIYEINETPDGQLYLVMAYYEGETLKQRIERGPLALNETLDIATQVGQGLKKAHAAGIVHRDIKPANLIVTADGTVKILDFGLAKLVGTEGVTQTGQTVGTVAYMSPEQARGEEVDHRTDIWSLGVVLYEMLTGQPPFRGENLLALSNAILQSQPPSLTGSSSSLTGVVNRALHKSHLQRYQAVTELLAELGTATGPASRATSHPDVPSIAVLPFANMSTDPENEFFADGISEDIINALGHIEGLRVAARGSAFFFKGKQVDLREVGQKLQVRSVLEGSVRRAGTRLRITAELVNAEDGYQLWSERYDRELEDIFDIQDEIARTIAERLEVTLTGGKQAPLTARATDNIKAYEAYLKGRGLLYKRGRFILDALTCFEEAVELDSDYALAWAGLADGRTTLGYFGMAAPHETMPQAKEAATRAVELDDSLAEARSGVELDHGSFFTHFCLQVTYFLAGRYPEAVAAGDAALTVSEHPFALFAMSLIYADWGKPKEARAVHDELMARADRQWVSPTVRASTAANAGLTEEVVTLTTRGIEVRDPFLMMALGSFPATEPLRRVLREAGKLDEVRRQIGMPSHD